MNIRQWALGVLVVTLIGCSGPDAPEPTAKKAPEKKYTTEQTAEKKPPEKTAYAAKPPEYLDQGWDHATRMEWWYTSQGTRVMPYVWFLALEQAYSKALVRSDENLKRFRFITWPADPKWNPDGLPIGFVADKDATSGEAYFGFTCAACHTGQVEYQGKRVIVEGGPALSDFDRLITELSEALKATLGDADKFSRFAERVLGEGGAASEVEALKGRLEEESAALAVRVRVNRPPHANGYGRLDAFGNIFNEVVVFAIDEPENAKPVNAPVSYPVMWDTPQHDVVQWNGAAVNAGIGPYTRNTGEVVGVFGGARVEQTEVAGSTKLRYRHHINIKALERLEAILTSLWSPVWPEEVLPAVDRDKAQQGKGHYDKLCLGCHQAIDRTDPNRKIDAKLIPVKEIGTDPTMALNVATRTSKTGIMEDEPMIPITKYLPSLGVIQQFEAEGPSAKMVGNVVLGILREELGLLDLTKGLPAYIRAAKANALYEDCDPKQEGKKCYRPPRYKARPLNGIWASAPFLHNGSVPNLWELLQKPDQRVARFHVGSWEMDPVRVGYVAEAGSVTSEFDTSVPGNSNLGHDYGTDLGDTEKWQLIEYIKTL